MLKDTHRNYKRASSLFPYFNRLCASGETFHQTLDSVKQPELSQIELTQSGREREPQSEAREGRRGSKSRGGGEPKTSKMVDMRERGGGSKLARERNVRRKVIKAQRDKMLNERTMSERH